MRAPPNPPGAIVEQPPVSPATPEVGAKKSTEKTPSKSVSRPPGTGSVRGFQNLPQPCIALYPYKPQKPDEIELKKGCVYYVLEKCQDGWFKGMSRNFVAGVFPGNYVAMIKSKEHFNSEAFQQMVSTVDDAQNKSNNSQSNPPTLPERDANSKSETTPTSGGGGGGGGVKEDKQHSKDDSTIGLLKRFTKNALSTRNTGVTVARKSSGEAENGAQPVHTR